MTLQYSLNENDYLQHQLFMASKSKRIQKQRRKSLLLVTFALLSLGFLFYERGNKFMGYYFLGFSALNLFAYPFYLRAHYRKHYQKYIADIYKNNRFDETATVTFNDDNIETLDITGESKINLSEIEEVVETGEYIYLRMKSGGSLIIPKLRVANLNNLRTDLQKLSDKLNINFVTDLNWKWR